MTCALVVRTWWKDLAWAQWSLASVERFARGFDEVVVILPRSSETWLRHYDLRTVGVRVDLCEDVADDYLGQQISKLHADEVTDADFICHLDSDCVFVRPVTPDALMPRGRPVVVTRAAGLMGRHWPWRESSTQFLGWPVRLDCMQRPPFVFPRWLYADVRNHCRRVHGVAIEEYVLACPPRGFSEFTVLGNLAHRFHRDAFDWVDAADAGTVPWCRWYWSWEGLTAETEAELQRLIEGVVPR
jgi:hypothetical protein